MSYTAADFSAAYAKGDPIRLELTDGTELLGDFVSVNSKGVNVKVDGKVLTRSLLKVAAHVPNQENWDEIEEGVEYTTSDLANVFHVSAKLLRVHLRAAGLGVGRGRKYLLRKADLANVRASLTA